MKVVKLTATAREDVESTRKRALPLKPENYPPDGIFDSDEYDRKVRGSPEVVKATEKLLADTNLWKKSAVEPVFVERFHNCRTAFGKYSEGTLLLYQDCLYDVRGHLTDDQRTLLVLEAADKERQLFERLRAKFPDDHEATTAANVSST